MGNIIKMHIMVASRKFGGVVGGVERMAITLMNEMVSRGHRVSLFTWDDDGDAESFYQLDKNINWIKLVMGNPAEKAGLILRLRRMMRVREILRKNRPDVILAFQEGAFVTLRLYSVFQGIPVICAIRNSPFRDPSIPVSPPDWLTHLVLCMARLITVQFSRYSVFFPARLAQKFRTIPNHVIPAQSFALPDADVPEKIILTTGRLSPEKNQAALVTAFAKIAPDFSDWKLVIVGRGSLEQDLKQQILTYNDDIARRIVLAGVSDDVPSWLIRAHIFCLPSWWEGFPNSLAEAMAHGLPCVGFRDCDGVCDLIDDNVTGLLADGLKNPDVLAEKLAVLMRSPELRRKMGVAGFEKTKQYDSAKVFDLWEKTLEEALQI